MTKKETLIEKKKTIISFLKKCNEYGKLKICHYEKKNNDTKKKEWTVYIKYNLHAINELNDTTLDHWLI